MLESALGDTYYFDGELISSDSGKAKELLIPTDEVTYYETVRIKHSVLLYVEDHLARLCRSVHGIEDFPVDTERIFDACRYFLNNCGCDLTSGNLRIVLTRSHILIHLCEANIPSAEHFADGIVTSILNWERVDPNIKVFRGDYKKAVADTFACQGKYGTPYEVLLTDRNDKLYEGSKSNLFVIVDDDVYSAPDDKILIGITRNRVLGSLEASGGILKTGMFTLEGLKEIKRSSDVALFVSSTPFDILPIRYVNDIEFSSADNPLLRRIAANYLEAADRYIESNRYKYFD